MKPSMAWIAVGWLILTPGFLRADDSQKDQEKLRGKWSVAEFTIIIPTSLTPRRIPKSWT
jgi:hypothetical protein